jgi:plastocyanin
VRSVVRVAPGLWWVALMLVIPLAVACAPAQARSAPPGVTPTSAAVPVPTPASSESPVALAGGRASIVSMTNDMKFEPASLTVPKGTTVTWRNASQTVHTVTDDQSKAANKAEAALPSGAQSWDSGDLNPGQTFTQTFDTPGTYRYFCIPHEMLGMTGTIVVTG